MKGPGPAPRALGIKTLTRVELQHLPQILAFFVVYANLTEEVSRFPSGPQVIAVMLY